MQTSDLPEMSTSNNSSKFNSAALTFVPSKKENQRLLSSQSDMSTITTNNNISNSSNKKSKQRFTKQPRPSSLPHSNYPKDIEEELFNGRTKFASRRGQISINHLLDFQFESEEHHQSYLNTSRRPNNNRRRKSNGLGPKIHLSGDRYINVNYKFVVDQHGDYRPQVLDTNLPLERNCILRVIIPKNDTQCPICLSDDLVAPRMTSCGHSFCLVCLMRYLDSEDPVPPKKKDQTHHLAPKLKECPLCSNKIKPQETIPVLINPIDERFETPKIGEEAILQLMYRPHNKILAFPYQMKLRNSEIYSGNIPWFSSSDSRGYNSRDLSITGNDLFQYSRIMKAGSKFVVDNYQREIDEIRRELEEDRLLYNDAGDYHEKAIAEIESIIRATQSGETEQLSDNFSNLSIHQDSQVGSELELEQLTEIQQSQTEFNDSNTFFFYQTSFNSKIKFFISALDNKILKSLYGAYSDFPLCLKIKIENIVYDYVVNDEVIKRFKFLSYLPHGTEIAFLELDWFESSPDAHGRSKSSKKKTSFLPPDVYRQFQKELTSRSDKIRIKNLREEKSRLRAQDELEWKTREFYANENNFKIEDYGLQSYNKFDTLSHNSDDDVGFFGAEDLNFPSAAESTADQEPVQYETTVWGTKIVKKNLDPEDSLEDDEDYFNELLRQSKEKEERKKGKKGKKKLVLMSS